MKPWKRLQPTEVTRAAYRAITAKQFEAPDGKTYEFGTYGIEGVTYVSVIALTADKKVVIAEQFRVGPEKVYQELPGGGIEEGETSSEAVLRELKEETGYTTTETPIFLGASHKDAYMNATHHYYLVRGCVKTSSQQLDDGEFVAVKEITIPELINFALTDQVSDALAVLYAYEQLKEEV